MVGNQLLERAGLWLGIGVLAGSLGAAEMLAQDLNNTGTINNSGQIVFRTDDGQFQSGSATADLQGEGDVVFEGLNNEYTDQNGAQVDADRPGYDAAHRIPYRTIYSAAAGTQNVQSGADIYFANLVMEDAAAKSIPDGVFVSEIYTASGGDRTYTGTFHYDGTNPQPIFAEPGSGGTNQYNSLSMENAGLKTLAAGDATVLQNDLTLDATNTGGMQVEGSFTVGVNTTQDALAPLAIVGDGSATDGDFITGTGAGVFAGAVSITNTGSLIAPNGSGTNDFQNTLDITSGDFTIQDGSDVQTVSGAMTAANDAAAQLAMENNTNLVISGSYTNNFVARTNQTFDDGSTVTYNGAANQTVVSSVASNPYGNLITDNGVKDGGGDIYMSGNLTVGLTAGAGGNLDMASGNYTLFMTDHTATATYDNDPTTGTEVVGAMRRTVDAGNAGPYTLNNTNTTVEFTTAPYTGYFEADVRPNTNPNNYDDTRDVNRKITLEFDNTGWTASIRAGYKNGEQGPNWGTAVPPTQENSLRFWEADGTEEQKVATGQLIQRDIAAAPIRWVELDGIEAATVALPNNSNAEFFSTNDLLLRGGPTEIIAIRDGRWSNPNTWDEGREPFEFDDVLIPNGFTVHTGYRRPALGEGASGEIHEGFAAGGDTDRDDGIAQNITVENGGGLMFGYDASGNPDEQNESVVWAMTTGGTILIQGNPAATPTTPDEATLATTAGNALDYEGLINFGNSGTGRGNLRTNQLENSGIISNGGTIQVGD